MDCEVINKNEKIWQIVLCRSYLQILFWNLERILYEKYRK